MLGTLITPNICIYATHPPQHFKDFFKPLKETKTMSAEKEFNENPFSKDTPVIPFSNSTEAMMYSEMNCQRCSNYEKCELGSHLDKGMIVGNIPLWVAKGLGCDYNALYGRVRLNEQCLKFKDNSNPMPF